MNDTTERATAYHQTIDDLRRALVGSSANWEKMSAEYHDQVMRSRTGDGPNVPDVVSDAYMASLMAMSYSYTLAAVLKVAQQELGEKAARRLAFEADEILTNGDFDNLNADVMPASASNGEES